MSSENRIGGVFAPVATPFDARYRPDTDRLLAHCRWLLERDVGLALFGTTSEANSMSIGEKLGLLEGLIDAGLPPARMLPGTGCCALPDSIELTRQALRLGCRNVLMLPPFYYPEVSVDGLYRVYAEVIEQLGDSGFNLYLYHIPQFAGVGIPLELIERLLADYPGTVAGIKDSSGDWDNMQAVLDRFQPRGFDLLSGLDSFLLATWRRGSPGCILGTANLYPATIAGLFRDYRGDDAEAKQALLERLWQVILRYPILPAFKAVIAAMTGDDEWRRMRPPLDDLPTEMTRPLLDELRGAGLDVLEQA